MRRQGLPAAFAYFAVALCVARPATATLQVDLEFKVPASITRAGDVEIYAYAAVSNKDIIDGLAQKSPSERSDAETAGECAKLRWFALASVPRLNPSVPAFHSTKTWITLETISPHHYKLVAADVARGIMYLCPRGLVTEGNILPAPIESIEGTLEWTPDGASPRRISGRSHGTGAGTITVFFPPLPPNDSRSLKMQLDSKRDVHFEGFMRLAGGVRTRESLVRVRLRKEAHADIDEKVFGPSNTTYVTRQQATDLSSALAARMEVEARTETGGPPAMVDPFVLLDFLTKFDVFGPFEEVSADEALRHLSTYALNINDGSLNPTVVNEEISDMHDVTVRDGELHVRLNVSAVEAFRRKYATSSSSSHSDGVSLNVKDLFGASASRNYVDGHSSGSDNASLAEYQRASDYLNAHNNRDDTSIKLGMRGNKVVAQSMSVSRVNAMRLSSDFELVVRNVTAYEHEATNKFHLILSGLNESAGTHGSEPVRLYESCNELYKADPTATSGVYVIQPFGRPPADAYCDMEEGGGWTRLINPKVPLASDPSKLLPPYFPGTEFVDNDAAGKYHCTESAPREVMRGGDANNVTWVQKFYRCDNFHAVGHLTWANVLGAGEVRVAAQAWGGTPSLTSIKLNGKDIVSVETCGGGSKFATSTEYLGEFGIIPMAAWVRPDLAVDILRPAIHSLVSAYTNVDVEIGGHAGPNPPSCHNDSGWGGGGFIAYLAVR